MPRRLLIIDDEAAVLHALELYFRNQGFAVDGVAEREQAEALIRCAGYDAVIADLRLAGGEAEGLAMVRLVRELTPRTKIVLLTAYGSAEWECEARRCGAQAFLHKPQSLSAVADVVSSLLAADTADTAEPADAAAQPGA
jgi:DNA-binding NtrC family response regulator